jgi:type VI protein secretion system component Hcp
MASSSADIYLILLRPSRVPVAGEAESMGFQGQVLIESWKWHLHNEDERKQAAARDDRWHEASSELASTASNAAKANYLAQDVQEAGAATRQLLAQADRKREQAWAANTGSSAEALAARKRADRAFKHRSQSLLDDLNHKLDTLEGVTAEVEQSAEEAARSAEQARREAEYEELDRNRNFEFTFTKRVDIASTQMLNSMKAGDVFPSGTLTIHQRSASSGITLVFTIQKIRLLDYNLQVQVTDTMTEMVEEWTAEFGALAYVYKNAAPQYTHANAAQAAAKTASQGTVRAFTMKNIGSPV